MATIWVPGDVLHGIDSQHATEFFRAVEELAGDGQSRVVQATSGAVRIVGTPLFNSVVAVVSVSVAETVVEQEPRGWRALVIPSYVLGELAEDQNRKAVFERLRDAANIDEARQRSGLKFIQRGAVAAIFIAGGYRRLHLAIQGPELVTILGVFDAEQWAEHQRSAKVAQPSETELTVWRRLHEMGKEARDRLRPLLAQTRLAPELGPLADGWIAVRQLQELGIREEAKIRKVLACTTENDLESLIGELDDLQFDRVDRAFGRFRDQEIRRAENKFDPMEVLVLQGVARSSSDLQTFEQWLTCLTEHQRKLVCLEREVPIRLKGGPGTGKTLTAMLRAGFLLRRAKSQQKALRVGFFVFSPDLGKTVYDEMQRLGLGEYLAGDGPQRLVVSSLQQWCERFIDVEKLGVEPIAPYRAGGTEKNRRALIELALDEARRRMAGQEHEQMWRELDVRSKAGMREIETEISQFIKAREISDLQSYLTERRPANWWTANSDKAFRRFVWEIYKVYEEVLKGLGLIDADDLINDSIKEVSKSVWQQFRKSDVAFDYLIVDEAQDFFRNQLVLIRHLVKHPEGLMIAYDEAQAVYSRYPSLRDIGFDTDSSFEGRRLESNFRSTRQVLQAICSVAARYPTCHFTEQWGNLTSNARVRDGERPQGFRFATEQAMFDHAADLVKSSLDKGVSSKETAVIVFDERGLHGAARALDKSGLRTTVISGVARKSARGAVALVEAKFVKGMQFEVCVVLGVDRDHLPDLDGARTDVQREVKREDELRLFLVAISRCKRDLYLLWHGTEPSEFVDAMGESIVLRG